MGTFESRIGHFEQLVSRAHTGERVSLAESRTAV